MKRITSLVAYFVFLTSVPCSCGAEGLGTLIDVAKSQADIKEQYEEETENFERVKKAVESDNIKKGMAKADIQRRYGDPVVSIKDMDGKREDCIYKPGRSSFFEGIRATLIYTEEGVLDEIRIEEK